MNDSTPTTPNFSGDDTVPFGDGNGYLPTTSPEQQAEKSLAQGAPDRIGPGTGDGTDSRPLGDPNAPQGTGPEVPGQALGAPETRPAPAGEVRVSHAESGDYSK